MSTIPADLAGAESFEGEIIAESADYTAYELLDPGTYLSASRKVSAGQAVDKNERAYIFALIEVSELQNENGETIVLNRPLKNWISTFPQHRKNQKGTTSQVADYLRAAGFEPAGLKGEELKQALSESAQYPVKLVIGWTNRTKPTGNKLPNGKDEFTEEWAKTKDFNVGTPDAPSFSPRIEKDGVVVQAKHRISFYKKAA